MLFAIEILGTIAFALSGAMVAIGKKMDIFGVAILGMTAATGGGIMRDLLLGVTPPAMLQHPVYALLALAVSLIAFLPKIRRRIDLDNFYLIIIDSVGLGLFAVSGVKAGTMYDNLFLQVFVGTITGVGGGVLRDMFAGERPMIFVRHFYASACLLGSLLCALLFPLGEDPAMISGAALIIILRMCAAKFKWHLPKA